MIIRPERKTDRAAIRRVNEAAFDQPAEADLVDALRSAGAVIGSLVAEVGAEVVGHILFSPAVLNSHSQSGGVAHSDTPASELPRPIAALGPMAVLPERQGQGIGSQLVVAGLEVCRAAGYDLVIVLGHLEFYPRFGFRPAPPLGIRWEHGADSHFMVMELQPGALAGASGVVRYRPEFDGV